MKTVVFELGRRMLDYTWLGCGGEAVLAGRIDRCAVHSAGEILDTMLEQVQARSKPVATGCGCKGAKGNGASAKTQDVWPDLIAVRVPFGGSLFRKAATKVDADVMSRLEELTPGAPIHLPLLVALIHACQQRFEGVPIVCAFDTAFFAELPAKEHLYAIDANVARSMQLRRYGYNGLLHEAACKTAGARRVLSICLEPRPELAAVVSGRPVMVTGGATPLEGLPGERSSGDIDPGIILTLAQDSHGLEQMNTVLTQQSGLLGLVGEAVTLADVFTDADPRYEKARDVVRYRILLACGAGVAAMGGVDKVVFSGRYAKVAEQLGPWLLSKLPLKTNGNGCCGWCSFEPSVEQVIADAARALVAH